MKMKMPQTASRQYLAQTSNIFYCRFKIKIPLEYGTTVLQACFDIIEEIDRKYNAYTTGSYFEMVNRHAGNWVTTDTTTVKILEHLKSVSALTQGAYDISVMPLLVLWGFYSPKAQLPDAGAIQRALQCVDYSKIEIRGKDVRIGSEQQIATGSFIKAYAVDQVVSFLKSKGIRDAVINAGGSTIYALNDDTHPQWHINVPGISDDKQAGRRIAVSNECFSLSGKAHNHIVIDGKRYGHIINAATGYPSQAGQVGLKTESAFWGDIISTALFAAAAPDTAALAAQLQELCPFEYYRIEDNGTKIYSTCF